MHRHSAGNGQWNSCDAPPQCLEAMGGGTFATHCHTALGQWATEVLQFTATLPTGSGEWNSFNALPHCLGAVGRDHLQCTATPPRAGGQWNSCDALPQSLLAVGTGPLVMHRHNA